MGRWEPRLLWLVLLAAVFLGSMMALGLAVGRNLPAVDADVLALVMLPPDSWPRAVVFAVNVAAGFPSWDLAVLLVALVVRLKGLAREALFVALSLSGDLVVVGFKVLFNRPRPSASVSDIIATSSYPSGHVARMLITLGVITAVLAWRRPGLRVPGIIASSAVVALVAFCRLASGEHWPTDILGGLLLGMFWLNVLLIGWVLSRKRQDAQ